MIKLDDVSDQFYVDTLFSWMCFVFQTVMRDSSLAVMACAGLSTLCVTEWMTVVTIVMRNIVVSFSYFILFNTYLYWHLPFRKLIEIKQSTFTDTLSTDRLSVAGVLSPQSGNLRWTFFELWHFFWRSSTYLRLASLWHTLKSHFDFCLWRTLGKLLFWCSS